MRKSNSLSCFGKAAGVFIPLVVLALTASAQAGGPGSTAAAGLKVAPGARPGGMGSAFIGLADDMNSLFWNPAGLANLEKPEVTFLHAMYLVDTSEQMIGYAQPFPAIGTFAAALTVLDYGSFDRTGEKPDGLFGGKLGTANPQDLFFTGGWGRAFPPIFGLERVKAGVSMKMTFQQLSGKVYPGFGFTAGALWDTPAENLRLGTVADNLGAASAGGVKALPISWAVGGSYGAQLGERVRMLYSMDMRLSVDTTAGFGIGCEAFAFDLVSVRLGWRGGGAEGGGTFGLGLSQPVEWFNRDILMRLDYNAGSFGILGTSHRFQLTARIGGSPLKNLGTLRLDRGSREPVLTWEGKGQAWYVLMRRSDEDEWRQLTDRPLEENRYALIGIAPGKYRFRVVEVDPYDPGITHGSSSELELVIQPPEQSRELQMEQQPPEGPVAPEVVPAEPMPAPEAPAPAAPAAPELMPAKPAPLPMESSPKATPRPASPEEE